MNYLLQRMKVGLTSEQHRQIWLASRWKLVDKEGEEVGVNPYLRRLVRGTQSPERLRVVHLGMTQRREAALAEKARMDMEAYIVRRWLVLIRELDIHVEEMRGVFEEARAEFERAKESAAAFVERAGAP